MSVYLGKTKRALLKRVKHYNNSELRAVINKHKNHLKHNFKWQDINILDYE